MSHCTGTDGLILAFPEAILHGSPGAYGGHPKRSVAQKGEGCRLLFPRTAPNPPAIPKKRQRQDPPPHTHTHPGLAAPQAALAFRISSLAPLVPELLARQRRTLHPGRTCGLRNI